MTTNTSIWQNTHVTMTTNDNMATIHSSRWQKHTRHDNTHTHAHIHAHTLIWQQYTHCNDNTHINMAATHTSIWKQYIRQDDNIHVNMTTTGTSRWQQHTSVNWQTHDHKLGNQSSKGKLFSELYSEHKSHVFCDSIHNCQRKEYTLKQVSDYAGCKWHIPKKTRADFLNFKGLLPDRPKPTTRLVVLREARRRFPAPVMCLVIL